MTDQPDDDKHIAPDTPAPAPREPVQDTGPVRPGGVPGRLVRIGCIVLAVFGLLGLYFGITSAVDPERTQCAQARAILEDEDEVEDGDDVECDDALAQAAALATGDDDVDEVSSESSIRTFSYIVAGIGLLQAVGGVLTLRLRTKQMRLVALVGAGLGIVFSPLGLLAVVPLGFVVYAILFSNDARALFGDPGGPRAFRPRT
jgi:hypothetical protein